jgi:NADPH2:quinone reductase
MRAIRYHEHGGPEVLQVDEIDRPSPGEREVLVEVQAAGVNHIDTAPMGGAISPPELPMIPGVDFAGLVEDVGEEVDAFDIGDRVFGAGLGMDRPGTYAEYVTVPLDKIAHLSSSVEFTHAAGIAHVGVAAWRALIDYGQLGPADTCLIHGGGGGVGNAAIQLAVATNAQVITTERPDEDVRIRLEELGADVVLDFTRDDLEDAVHEAADGVDVILDTRLNEYLQFNINVAASGGRIITIAGNKGEITNAQPVRSKDLLIRGMGVFNTPDMGVILRKLARLMEVGAITTEIAHTYDLDGAAEAQRALSEDEFLGKLIIEI